MPIFMLHLKLRSPQLSTMMKCNQTVLLQLIMSEISLLQVVRYLRQKGKLTVSGQYRYDMRHIVMSLNNTCIDFIKQQFHYNDNRLDLLKFVWLMRQALDHDPNDYFICYELVRLFEEIDIDASQTIEWSEFLQFLSQSNWLSAPAPVKPANARDGSLLVHAFHEEAKYRKHSLKRVVELARHNSLALLANNNSLSFLGLQRSHDEQKQTFTLGHVDCGRVLALDFAEQQRLFGVLLTNRNLVFVEDGEMQKILGVVRSSGNEVDIRYLPLHKLWVLESVNSSLQVFASPKGGVLGGRVVFRPHQQPLTGVREVGWPLTLCTASLDGLLKLWQVASGRLVIELDVVKERGEAERKGVKGVATYNRAGVAFLCTWMFTSEIFLWLPSLSLSKPFAGELHGHLGLVTDCVFAWRGELISLDDKRAVRVWNPEKLQCLQSFTISEEGCSLVVLRAQPYLLTYARLIDFYRLRTNSKADLQSQVGSAGRDGRNVLALQGQGGRLLAVEFSPYYSFLIVLTSQQLKIFDVNAVASIAGIRPPNSFQFTASAMKGMRRVCLATSAGMVEERKVEDGQLVRRIEVCPDPQLQDLKFVLYHEETKILVAVVEGEDMSKLVTFDMLSEEATRVKEIQFQQVGLHQLKTFPQSHRFFILSADSSITIWDYDKLIIINRIDLQACAPSILSGGISMIPQPINQCIIIQSGKGLAIVTLDPTGSVQEVTVMEQPQGSALVAAGLLLQSIPQSFLQQEKVKKTKREMQFDAKKKVDFQMFDRQADKKIAPETYEQIFILAVAHKKGEISYYRLDELLRGGDCLQIPPSRGKMQRVKQHRRAHMRPFLWSGAASSFDLSLNKFTQEYSFISGVERAGTTLGHFYFHNSENQLFLLSPFAQMRAQWALSLPRPKYWSIAYNQLNEVLARLDKTQKALEEIYHVPVAKFKVDFLAGKYLNAQEIQELARAAERTKKQAKSTTAFNSNQMGSRKSIVSINDKLTSHNEKEEKTVISLAFRKQADNLFEKKLQEHEKRRMVHRNSKDLFQKVQRSLSYSRLQQPPVQHPQHCQPQPIHPTPERPQKSNFAIHMDGMLNSAINHSQASHLVQNSSVKSMKKDIGRSSVNAQDRPQSNGPAFRSRSSGLKNRIQSSLGELSKNFTAGKIEWQNFRKGMAGEALGLAKRGKLKL